MAKHNWPVIKAEYIEGIEENGARKYPSYSELAEKHGIRADSIRRRAAHDRWLDERHIFASKLQQVRQTKKVEVLASKAAEFDAKALRAQEVVIRQVVAHLEMSDKDKVPLSIHMLEKAANTIEKAHKSGRLALGEPTENPQPPSHELTDAERAAGIARLLDAARARRAGQPDGNEPQGTGGTG